MRTISVYDRFYSQSAQDRPIQAVLAEIRSGKYGIRINKIRSLKSDNKKQDANEEKKLLPAFTPSGTFKMGRKANKVTSYSGLLILDIDNLDVEKLTTVKELATKIEFTYSCFVSPSGNGLKILVKVDSGSDLHKLAFQQVANHYASSLGTKIDPSGKDVSRLCFYSSDSELYINDDSTIFEVKEKTEYDALFQETVDFTKNKIQFEEGSRNCFVHLLANNCNRCGIPENEATSLIKRSFNYDNSEVNSTIKSAYTNTEEHDTVQIGTSIDVEFDLLETSTLPTEVYEVLPDLLKMGTSVFDTQREKDLFLTGALTVLSGCMDTVTGVYDQQPVHANLYSFIIAPAASGKGAMAHAKQLAMNIHKELLVRSNTLMKEYKASMKLYKKEPKEAGGTAPDKPKFEVLYFPANSSSSAVISHLGQSDSKGIIFETEADTMGNSFKQDWGGYSDLLRKAFHHEPITYSRKSDDEFIEVSRPRLSVALSGTPSQVSGLVHSSEDGLFSRFIFYTFRVKSEWRNVSPSLKKDFNRTLASLSDRVERLHKELLGKDIDFQLSDAQWELLNSTFSDWLKETVVFVGEDATSTIKRLGVIVFRLAMILTVLRKHEENNLKEVIICNDNDFRTAMLLASVYKEHAQLVFSTLEGNKKEVISRAIRQFFDALPNDREFSRKEAIGIGSKLGLKERTVGKYLKTLLDGYLDNSSKFGSYKK